MSAFRTLITGFVAAVALVGIAHARDTTLHLPIRDVLEDAEFKPQLAGGAELHFGKAAPAGKFADLGEFVTNRKTNAFGKSDEKACKWAMLSALLQLQEKAKALGGNAVVNIRSYYKRDESWSDTEYECHAGGLIGGVALKGRIVRK